MKFFLIKKVVSSNSQSSSLIKGYQSLNQKKKQEFIDQFNPFLSNETEIFESITDFNEETFKTKSFELIKVDTSLDKLSQKVENEEQHIIIEAENSKINAIYLYDKEKRQWALHKTPEKIEELKKKNEYANTFCKKLLELFNVSDNVKAKNFFKERARGRLEFWKDCPEYVSIFNKNLENKYLSASDKLDIIIDEAKSYLKKHNDLKDISQTFFKVLIQACENIKMGKEPSQDFINIYDQISFQKYENIISRKQNDFGNK